MNRVSSYLSTCQVRAIALGESEEQHVPPTPQETQSLIRYLRSKNLKPVIVGSVGLVHHLKSSVRKMRPTKDLDVFVSREPGPPPEGWKVDSESIGVTSWVSTSGGYVDFLVAGKELHGENRKFPKSVSAVSGDEDYPVADALDLIRMKLATDRAQDLTDIIILVSSMKKVPSLDELGKLSSHQKENWDTVVAWLKAGKK